MTLICDGGNAQELMDAYARHMCLDIQDSLGNADVEVEERTTQELLLRLKRLVGGRGRTMSDFGLPDIVVPPDDASEEALEALDNVFERHVRRFTGSRFQALATRNLRSARDRSPTEQYPFTRRVLTAMGVDMQRHDPDAAMNVDGDNRNGDGATSRCFYLDGKAGTGKTFVMETIAATLRARGDIVLICAFTGLAASLHEGGMTAHRLFHLPLHVGPAIESSVVSNVDAETPTAQLLREAALIMIDELPMLHRNHLERIDITLRDIMGDDRPFGGKFILGAGDFRQTSVVVESASRRVMLNSVVLAAPVWRAFQVTVLSTSIRQSGDAAFADIVTGVGDGAGIVDGDGQWRGWWRVPTCIQVFDNPDEAREWVFGGANTPYERAQRALLAPRNEDVDAHNHAFVHALDGDIVRLCGHEHRDDERPAARGYDNNRGSRLLSETFMAVMKRPGVPPHVLQLKVGCICMCMRNLDPELGLLNGTKLRILRLGLRVIEAEILRVNAGAAPPVRCLIPRINFTMHIPRVSATIRRVQFPLRPAYAMTVNKSQGQTLRRVVVDLRSQCFAHGQLYVALSRVRNAADVRFLLDVTTCQSVDDNGEEVSGTYAWALAGWCGCWNTDWASAWNRSHGEKCCVEGAAASRTCQSTSSVAAATQRRAARRRSPGHWRRA